MARGDTAAIAALYDRHARQMLGLAERIAGGRPQAEDLVHDVFVEAWRCAADYDQTRGSVKAWLLLRTRSRAIDYRKSANVARTVVGADTLLATLADPVAEVDVTDRSRLRARLAALSEEQREVLVLGYFEGLSSSEIAERIAVPIGTVKSRVAAALASLRRSLRECEVKP
ncbi:MAG TPA: sigma-70 family RNA polymerase sigma factor [Polyangiaceae bacterium]|jgi:RNA polymerase sigma-70 factor (ECF subfamily)